MADEIKYYFNEETNQIFVSGSSTKSGMNTLLTSPKNSPIVNGNTTAKISSLGTNLTYVVQNGSDTTTIPIADNQELWVYRGWQPANTGDANAYRYNPHLHRPYKAYMLTETGSGVTASPFSPTGFPLYSNIPFNTGNIFDVADKYDERVLGSNGSISTQDRVNSVTAFSGSFTIENQNREVYPYVFTKYGSLLSIASGSTVEIKDSTQTIVETLVQTQTLSGFTTVPISGSSLTNGEYTFTSSVFNKPNSSDQGATQFGLFTEYADFVEYEASNLSTTNPVRVTYTSSDEFLSPVYFDLPQDKKVTYTALVGTPSFTPVSGFTNTIVNPSASAVGSVQNLFATRVNDVYISYSSSLSQSIDGLYIFNQIPSADIQVTVSAFFQAWAGLDSGYQYGETNTTYSISPDPPHYGNDTSGQEPTFPTASILIYTGSYPSAVPTVLDDHYVSSSFSSSAMNLGLAVTMSTLIPSSSISLKDCLSVAISVSSGSANSASVEQALIVSRYELVFNTPLADTGSDGRVPVFIENAFAGTDGFENAVDCQPLYNTIVTNNTLRRNPLIQEIEYNIPENFQLDVDQRLLASQTPFDPLNSISFFAYEYDSTVVNTYDTGKFRFVSSPQVNSPVVEINNRYYPEGDSANTSVIITNNFDVWENSTNRIIKFPSTGGDLQFNVSGNPTYTPFPSVSSVGKYSITITDGTTTGANSPFSDGDKTTMELLSGEVMTNGASMIVTQVPLPDGTVQIETTGTGTGLELDIRATNLGTELFITVSSPGRGHQDGDLLTIPQAVLSPVFGSAIVRDLEITLSFTYGLYNPSNFEAILEDAAIKSSVPESFYTQTSSIIPRYVGAKSSADFINSINGLVGGFGKVPVIDYKTAYFAYCDQVIDLYPTINNKTLFNIKYLINEGGDALQPNLSEYTAFDVEGSWQAGGKSRVGINQISGSSQYDVLNNEQDIYLVTKLPTAYLWSQTGAGTYSGYIPFGGTVATLPQFSDDFVNYSMNIAGESNNVANNNSIEINSDNVIGNFPTSPPTTIFTNNYTVKQGAKYGEYNGIVFASSSILTTSGSGGDYYANPGEIYFTTDEIARINTAASNNLQPQVPQLSDDYNFLLTSTFTLSPVFEYRTSGYGPNKSNFQGDSPGESVGSLTFWLESTSDSPSVSGTWTREPIELVGDVILQMVNGGNTTNINLSEATSDPSKPIIRNIGLSKYKLIIKLCPYDIEYALGGGNLGDGAELNRGMAYAQLIFTTRKKDAFISDKRYRFSVNQQMDNMLTDSRDGNQPQNNIWQPTKYPNLGEQQNNRAGTDFDFPLFSPRFDLSIEGIKTPSLPALYDPTTDPNSFKAPYWKFSGSLLNPGGFVYDYDTIVLEDPVGNAKYNTGEIMGNLAYTASANPRFPGGVEPADSGFDFTTITWEVRTPSKDGREFDEIRFENSENLSRKILEVTPPDADGGKLKLVLDGELPSSTNLDFFILRRNVFSPNSILINKEFPYGSLPISKEFIPSTNNTTLFFDNNDAPAEMDKSYRSEATSSQSGSFVTTYKPLLKSDNTPAGILFPQYPTELIDINPDEVIVDLRDKKLIE